MSQTKIVISNTRLTQHPKIMVQTIVSLQDSTDIVPASATVVEV
ncbi:MAG: hypothetical protein ACHBN1_30160 [Heteroscytonema crispum UTEX LB 1556]